MRIALLATGRTRRLLRIPTPVVSRALRLLERAVGERAFATWDELELMEVSMVPADGHGDAQALGVHPRTMASVLGLS